MEQDYPRALRLPEDKIRGKPGSRHVLRQDIENLEECAVLYFRQYDRFKPLWDYPCMGASEFRLRESVLQGPFTTPPECEKDPEYPEASCSLLEALVPSASMPVSLEEIMLVEYGTATDHESLRHLGMFLHKRPDVQEMRRIAAGTALGRLENYGTVTVHADAKDQVWRVSGDYFILEAQLDFSNAYPSIMFKAFGRKDAPLRLIEQIGIYALADCFPDYPEIGLLSAVRQGFAYGLELGERGIDELLKKENVLVGKTPLRPGGW